MKDHPMQLDYFFDPFCGWCYASATALEAVAEAYPQVLAMRPSGLFANTGARPIATIADHAWRNDQRIFHLTGQRFSVRYRDEILLDADGVFDSIHATRAIVALGELDGTLEPKALHALQIARYIDAKDTSRAEVVAAVAAQVARSHGYAADDQDFTERLIDDLALAHRTEARIGKTVELLRALPSSGVPQLLVTLGDHHEVVPGQDLYCGAARVLGAIEGSRSNLERKAS